MRCERQLVATHVSADGDVDRKRRHPAVRRYLPLHRGITLAVLLGISRRMGGG
jgi:hypothetical protein